MTFKVIRDLGQVHAPVKFAKMAEIEVISSVICERILNIVEDYDSTGQYLNLIEPDFPIPLSFSFYGTSKLIQNAYFH